MMRFTMNAKDLKAMMEKGMTAINKRVVVPTLARLYFQVDEKGTVRALGTDMDHYAEARSDDAYQTSPGVLGIDVDDIKILTKMNGEITLEDVTTEDMNDVGKINIRCGKKLVTIPRYSNTDVFLPSMDETEAKILTVKESWLLDTVVNLDTYTSSEDNRKMMQVFNFNTKAQRVETLDGHRIGMRTLENQIIHEVTENPFETVKIHKMCVPVFKKLLDKKSEREVEIYQDKKYIRVEGKDFTYVTRRVDGEYFDISKMLGIAEDFRFVANRENMLEVMKYDADLAKTVKDNKIPVILHSENRTLYSYIATAKYESFDELETKENRMKNDLYIGFNPQYLADVFSIVDSDEPVCAGSGAKSPMIIYGNEYSFLVLSVNLNYSGVAEILRKKIGSEVA